MHAAASTARSCDTDWHCFLAPKKRDAIFRQKVALLHREFCDCEDFRNHILWPTPPTTPGDDDGEGGHIGEEDVDNISDNTIIDAGDGIVTEPPRR